MTASLKRTEIVNAPLTGSLASVVTRTLGAVPSASMEKISAAVLGFPAASTAAPAGTATVTGPLASGVIVAV